MKLSSDLISQFVKVTNDKTEIKKESTVYGTAVEHDGTVYVKIDGSELLTPVETTTDMKNGERVTVTIKNHTATVTGNISSPSARTDTVDEVDEKVKEVSDQITDFEIVVSDLVSTDELNAEKARIDNLVSENVKINDKLTANEAYISKVEAESGKFNGKVEANEAEIKKIKTEKIDITTANATFATIVDLEATDAEIYNLSSAYGEFVVLTTEQFEAVRASINTLDTNKLSAQSADLKYANIDFSNIGKAAMECFYAKSGLIKDVTVGDQTITGHLVGVTISGDLIEGNTIKAEKLVIKGDDGLYYKLNTNGVVTEAEQTDKNSLNGSIIKAKSITASKISVKDLVAFGATIGGFHLTDKAIYSGTKETAANTTRGVYLDSEGQMAVGDTARYFKYYKKTDGSYALELTADSIRLSSGKDLDVEVGGRNLLLDSATKSIVPYSDTTATHESNIEVTEWLTTDAKRMYGTCGGSSVIFGTLGGTANYGASSQTQSYSTTIYVKNNHTANTLTVSANHGSSLFEDIPPGGCKRVELVGPGNGWGYLQLNFKTSVAGDEYDITYWRPKIELGNSPTDWSPAPEDMATSDDVDAVSSSVEATQKRVTDAEALLELLSESISMLVTDGSGASLMKQTDGGWTFSTGDLQDAVNRASESLDTLTHDVGDVHNTIDILQQAVSDLGTLADYVKIGTYENEPCIELGESDSDFKLLITNTRIMFREGTGVPAYFTNQSMHIKKAVVEEELQQGGFVWKARANGNLGLVWKGVTS